MTAQDMREFTGYLRQCTDRQVQGVYDHERTRGGTGEEYAELAVLEADRRGIHLERGQ